MTNHRDILNTIDKLRGLINHRRRQSQLIANPENWNVICSCLDTLEDTDVALESSLTEIPNMQSSLGTSYLQAYGTLQAIFVQQDALANITDALGEKANLDFDLKEIRELRNDAIGHPTLRSGNKSSSFIVQKSLNGHGFSLMTVYPDGRGPTVRQIVFQKIIATQRAWVAKALASAISRIEMEDQNHKAEFSAKPLAGCFPDTLSYFLGKIIEGTLISVNRPIAEGCLDTVKGYVDCVEQGLKERGILESYEGFEDQIRHLNYAITELRAFFSNKPDYRLNENDAYIFAMFFRQTVDSLVVGVIAVDEEYEA